MASHRSFQRSISQILSHLAPAFTLIYTELHKNRTKDVMSRDCGCVCCQLLVIYSEANLSHLYWGQHVEHFNSMFPPVKSAVVNSSCMQNRPTLKKKCHSVLTYVHSSPKHCSLNTFGSLVLQFVKLLCLLSKLLMEIIWSGFYEWMQENPKLLPGNAVSWENAKPLQ